MLNRYYVTVKVILPSQQPSPVRDSPGQQKRGVTGTLRISKPKRNDNMLLGILSVKMYLAGVNFRIQCKVRNEDVITQFWNIDWNIVEQRIMIVGLCQPASPRYD